MNGIGKILPASAFAWAFLSLTGVVLMVLIAPLRNYDIYDVQAGLRALDEQPLLVIAGQLVFAWAGLALIGLALDFYDGLPAASRDGLARMALVFGAIAGAFFLFFGLVGAFGSAELRYIQSVHPSTEVGQAYLALALVTNRTQAAAITLSGVWFALASWLGLRSRALPAGPAYLGLAAGALALPGFLLPGGGFGLLSLSLSALWGLLAGFRFRRGWATMEASS